MGPVAPAHMSVQMCKAVDVSQDASTEESSLRPTGIVIYLGKSVTVPKGSTSTAICLPPEDPLPNGQSGQMSGQSGRKMDEDANEEDEEELDGAALGEEDNVRGVLKCLQ